MFFSAAYRDINTLPYISSLKDKKAQLLGVTIYIFGAIVFTISFISYILFNGLKDKSSSTTTTVENDSCVMLSAVDKSVEASDLYKFIVNENNIFGYYLSFGFSFSNTMPSITYDKSFYSTYQKCIDSVSISCSVQYSFLYNGSSSGYINGQLYPYNTSEYNVFSTCYIADKISLTGLNDSLGMFNTPLTCTVVKGPCLDWFNCLNYFTSSNMTSLMNSLYPASTICQPFYDNPPYQCTTYTTKSYLKIISQSLAIASGFTQTLFSLSLFVLKHNHLEIISYSLATLSAFIDILFAFLIFVFKNNC